MRNFSMKKLGTPMRAGPGCASEIVGFWSVGEPSRLRVGVAESGFAAPRSTLPTSDSAFAPPVGGARCGGAGVRTVPPLRLGAEPPFDDVFSPPPEPERSGVAEGEGVGDGVAVWVGEGTDGSAGVALEVEVATGPRSVML